MPVTVGTLEMRQRQEGQRVMTVTRIVTQAAPCDHRHFSDAKTTRRCKSVTVTRIATPGRPILVTVGTFGRSRLGEGDHTMGDQGHFYIYICIYIYR